VRVPEGAADVGQLVVGVHPPFDNLLSLPVISE